jgi:diguanylate cyclase (GGDEF)-like protein
VYDGWSAEIAAEVAANILLWAAIGVVMLTLMVTIRGQRVSLREGQERERELARADALTGLGNRRAFDEALAREIARAERAGSKVCMVLVDLDGLKRINDGFGHVEGDRCLTAVASAIGRSIRAGDQAFRWGGDEFAILLPDTDYDGAEVAAASIYAEIMRTCADARGRPLSVSAGIAEAVGEVDAAELIERADMELMARKRDKAAVAND